jgi:hypothetical protein
MKRVGNLSLLLIGCLSGKSLAQLQPGHEQFFQGDAAKAFAKDYFPIISGAVANVKEWAGSIPSKNLSTSVITFRLRPMPTSIESICKKTTIIIVREENLSDLKKVYTHSNQMPVRTDINTFSEFLKLDRTDKQGCKDRSDAGNWRQSADEIEFNLSLQRLDALRQRLSSLNPVSIACAEDSLKPCSTSRLRLVQIIALPIVDYSYANLDRLNKLVSYTFFNGKDKDGNADLFSYRIVIQFRIGEVSNVVIAKLPPIVSPPT